MNVMSLFAGIGGIDLGLERAGMTTVAQVEIDPYCQQVLARHWPGVPRHDDVRTTVEWWASEPRPTAWIMGFPCDWCEIHSKPTEMPLSPKSPNTLAG